MSEKYAVRNIRLCTKDCLCLYVCPTGATNTENSIIDKTTCTGCGACAESCPSGAICLVPRAFPPQQLKQPAVVDALRALIRSKSHQEAAATAMGGKLGRALQRSNRILAEDLFRESGFMLPQGAQALALLQGLVGNPPEGFPVEVARELLERL